MASWTMRIWGAWTIVAWVSEGLSLRLNAARCRGRCLFCLHRPCTCIVAHNLRPDPGPAAYVSGALGAYFNKQSGIKDRVNVEVWSGIIGISADFMPWVGR